MLKDLKWSIVFSGIVYIGLGVLLLIMPNISLEVILNIIGVGIIIVGILFVIRYFTFDVVLTIERNELITGLIFITLGAMIFFRKDIFASLIPIVLGLIITFSGFVKLQDAVAAQRLGYDKGIFYIVLAVINIIGGIVILLNPFQTAVILFMVIGGCLIYSGLFDMISALLLSRRLSTFADNYQKNLKAATNTVATVEVMQTPEVQVQPSVPEAPVETEEAESDSEKQANE